MKTKLLIFCLGLTLFAAPIAWAIPTTGPWNYDGADSILGYQYLHPANETNELAFANVVLSELGMGTTSLLNGTGEKYTPSNSGLKSITFDPGFAWEYAVVKVDGPQDFAYLFRDNYQVGGDDILQTPLEGTLPFNMRTKPLGISHITWFGPSTVVPEPSTMLLLAAGLVGLGIYGRERRRK